MVDVVVVGAGMAGLVCAQQLRRSGYRTVVVEKSRGLGGRVATRRLLNTCADHGVRYLEAQGELTQQLIRFLLDRDILRPWAISLYQLSSVGVLQPAADCPPAYVAPDGMTAVAKALATGLEICRSQRVTAIEPIANQHWQLTLDGADGATPTHLTAKAIVLTVRAPQALRLVEPIETLPAQFLTRLQSVEFDPCITAIAAYPQRLAEDMQLPWQLVSANDAVLREVIWDSHKRLEGAAPVFVLHSSAEFARQQFEVLDRGGQPGPQHAQPLLDRAAETLIPWLNLPELLQIQRWRYAFVRRSLPTAALYTNVPLPLVCAGDWCGGSGVEAALRSGEAAAQAVSTMVGDRPLPELRFRDFEP